MLDQKHMHNKYSGETHHSFSEWFNHNLKKENKKIKIKAHKSKVKKTNSNSTSIMLDLLFGD
eukprot:COSAG01_NODE_740_length_13891_cov_35.573013_17_plen_62_part_00